MHGRYETAEVRNVRRIDGEPGRRRSAGKIVNGVLPGRAKSFQHQRRRVDGCSLGRGELAQDVVQGAERFMAKLIAAEKVRTRVRHAVVCPNVTGRTRERISQSKRARADSLAIVDKPQVAGTCILRALGLQMSCHLSLVLR